MVHRDLLGPIFQSRTLKHVTLRALAFGAYSCLAVWKENSSLRDAADIPSDAHTLLSFLVSMLLVFRTNAAYNRWWEARTLWGTLVNASRNFTCKLVSLGRIPAEEIETAARGVSAFAFALRNHLRGEPTKAFSSEGSPELEANPARHAPSFIVNRLYASLGQWKAQGWLDGDELRVFDQDLVRFLDVCGGCERILRTRIARSYRAFARQCVLLVLITLPWGIVHDFQGWTIPLTIITAYFMLGLEIVAEHVEEPFGYDEDDLDLDGLCDTIDNSVREILLTRAEARTER
jgi:ion channel-forming bestrophin family protein